MAFINLTKGLLQITKGYKTRREKGRELRWEMDEDDEVNEIKTHVIHLKNLKNKLKQYF